MNDSDKEINTDRRIAPRHQVNLNAPVIITAIGKSEINNEQYLVLQGQILDVSRTGLALIISYVDWLELKQLKDNPVFRLLLPLPIEAIELEATPVRYQQLGVSETGNILVGANITKMNGRDRILFIDFISEFE